MLKELGYLSSAGDDATVTPEGRMLQRLYTELDLLGAQCLRAGVWEGLNVPELAACASLLIYESRSNDDETLLPKTPAGPAREAIERTGELFADLTQLESDNRLSFLRVPDAGFAWAAYRWASGHRLESVLRDADMTAGDFVRWSKMLADVLGQIADAAGSRGTPAATLLSGTARDAVNAVKRGVVSFSSV